jgi:hypothetical protein
MSNFLSKEINLKINTFAAIHIYDASSKESRLVAMFQLEMTEKKTGQVNIQDIQPDKQLLHYIYRLFIPLTETTAL